MRFGLLVLAVLLFAVRPAAAQTQAEVDRFRQLLNSKEYIGMLQQLTALADADAEPQCKERKLVERFPPTVYAPPVFPEGEGSLPTAGLWRDRVKVERCGKAVYHNVLVMPQPKGPPRSALLMPGLTGATPPTQEAIMKDFVAALASGKNKCTDTKDVHPLDSVKGKDVKPRKRDDKGQITEGTWTEIWTFRACGKVVNATVEYTVDGKGGLSTKVKL